MSLSVRSNSKSPTKKLKDLSFSSSSYFPLPDVIVLNCFARVPRSDYPSLSLVCKTFRRLIASSELNISRSLFRNTENVLYVALSFNPEQNPLWYTLNQKPNLNESNSSYFKLVPFPSFPLLPCWGSSVILVGQEIYVLGGYINGELTANVFVIDCLLRTCRFLPSMRVARGCAAFGVVDDKIYVIGGCNKTDSMNNWIEVFDLKTQSWEPFSSLCKEELKEKTLKSLVMNEKIYIMNGNKSFVYDPKKNIWEEALNLNSGWQVGSCVIDNMMYTFGDGNRINVFDPKVGIWTIVKGVEVLHEKCYTQGRRMVNHGGKLAILLHLKNYFNEGKEQKISCVVVALERRGPQGEIWGKVLWSNIVLCLKKIPFIVQCFDVTI